MRLESETRRADSLKVFRAAVDVEHFVALPAIEVMVVMLAGDFVAGGFGGDFDRYEPTAFDEPVDCAVDGGSPDLLETRTCQLNGLARR